MLIAVLKGIHWHDFRDPERHSFIFNTAISIAKVENGKIELIKFNDVEHLD